MLLLQECRIQCLSLVVKLLSLTLLQTIISFFGHFDLYTFRRTMPALRLIQSEHVKFLDNQTVFRGVARYDGKPAIDEGFGVMTIDGKAPVTSATFRADDANDATLTSLTLGSETLAFNANTYEYEVSATTSNAVVNAVPAQEGASVTIMYGGRNTIMARELTLEGTKNLVVTVKERNVKTCLYCKSHKRVINNGFWRRY
ncbi:MAG: phage major capsid protein [Holdemanella porci]